MVAPPPRPTPGGVPLRNAEGSSWPARQRRPGRGGPNVPRGGLTRGGAGFLRPALARAAQGFQLLKKKADALTLRFRQILKQILTAKQQMGEKFKDSFFAMAQARYTAGDHLRHSIVDSVAQATVRVQSKTDNIAGVKVRPPPPAPRAPAAARD